MKKFLCYLGVFLLLALVLLPPALRIFVPKQDDNNNLETTERKNLRCSNSRYIVSTSYDGDELASFVIKQFKTDTSEEEINEETDDNTDLDSDQEKDDQTPDEDTELIESPELDRIYAKLREETLDDLLIQSDGEVISLDFSLTDNSEYSIDEINGSLNDQKAFYESQGLTCSIM